jgi:hypothetical protein
MKESSATSDNPSNARVPQGLPGQLCYIYENKMVRYQLTGFGELC